MIQIELAAIANQVVSVRLGDSDYSLTVLDTGGVMSVDIVRDGTTILTGQRAVSGSPLILYPHLSSGNFVFITENENYPDWRNFGTSCFLLYASPDEVAAMQSQYQSTISTIAASNILANCNC